MLAARLTPASPASPAAFQGPGHPEAGQMCHPPTAVQRHAPSTHPQTFPLDNLGASLFPCPQCLDCSGAAKKNPKSGADITERDHQTAVPPAQASKGSLERGFSRCSLQGSVFLCRFCLSQRCNEGEYKLRHQKHISPFTAAFQVAAGFSPGAGTAQDRSLPSLSHP